VVGIGEIEGGASALVLARSTDDALSMKSRLGHDRFDFTLAVRQRAGRVEPVS